MKKQIIQIIYLILTINLPLTASPEVFNQHIYIPESWRQNEPRPFESEGFPYPDSILFAYHETLDSEPMGGYPYHSGLQIGLSDTTDFCMNIVNYTGHSIDITNQYPENWFEPVLYNIADDVRTANPTYEPPESKYRFGFWTSNYSNPMDKPLELQDGDDYILRFYLWDLPEGRHRLAIRKTKEAPADLRILTWCQSPIWIEHPKVLADTLNCYFQNCMRSMDFENYIDAEIWASKILTLNPYSIIGNNAMLMIYNSKGETTTSRDYTRKVIEYLEDYSDPVLPYKSNMDKWWRKWRDNRMETLKGALDTNKPKYEHRPRLIATPAKKGEADHHGKSK